MRNIRYKITWFILAVGLLSVVRAAAQETPAPAENAPAGEAAPAEPAAQPGAAAAPDPAVEEARKHFLQAVAFADAGNCEGAIAEFQAAYRLVPRPNALYNIGQCQERLFRYDLAIEYYNRYLKEAPADAPDRAAVNGALNTLHNLLGTLHIASNVPADVWVDDRLAGKAPGDVLLPAGRHSVELRAEGYIPARTEAQLVGREEASIEMKLEKARTTVRVTETTGLSPLIFWIGAATTVAVATTGGIFGLRVLQLRDDARKIPALHPDREDAQKDVQKAELTADIFFATAGVLGIGTIIVAFLTDWDGVETGGEKTSDTGETALNVTPLFSTKYAGVSLRGALP